MNLIKIESVNGQNVVDSRLIAQELGIKHKNLLDNIEKYCTELQQFGTVTFETETCKHSTGASVQKFVYLNENQATFVMTLSRNTKKVVALKANLVASFSKAKQVISEQGDRIKELELTNEHLRLQVQANQSALQLGQFRHLITTTCPEPTQQKILGYEIVEKVVEKPTIIKENELINDGSTINKTQLCHRYGILTKNGKPNYSRLNKLLEQTGCLDGKYWKESKVLRTNLEFDLQYLNELDQKLDNKERQMWLGE